MARPHKATHEQLRRHNRQMLLRAVYQGIANSRAGLAQATGLTKPTVSNLVAELIDDGFVSESGHGPASESGGKRPTLIEFQPGARQIIGVAVDHFQVSAALTDLAGNVIAQQRVELDPERPFELVAGAIDGLRAQLDAPLLCIGVGLPGDVDAARGLVRRSAALGWRNLSFAEPLAQRYGVPVHVGHGTELAALAQYAFGDPLEGTPDRLLTLLVERGVEVGVTLEQGAVHYGGDLGSLRLPLPGGNGQANGDGQPVALAQLLGGSGPLALRVRSLLGQEPDGPLDYLQLRYQAARGDARASELIAEVARLLAPVVAWSVALLRPDSLSISGPLTELGDEFTVLLHETVETYLPSGELDDVPLSLAHSRLSGALGAVALALQKEVAIV